MDAPMPLAAIRRLYSGKIAATQEGFTGSRSGQGRSCGATIDAPSTAFSATCPVTRLPKIAAEIAPVTSGCFIATARPAGRAPTILLDSIDKARRFRHDNSRDQYEIELCDGRRIKLGFQLFTASELRSCVADVLDIEDLRGLDLFHNRFAPAPLGNPASLADDDQFTNEFDRLEEAYATRPRFMERAAHLLLVARRQQPAVKIKLKPITSAKA